MPARRKQGFWSRRAENCGASAVAFLSPGMDARRCATKGAVGGSRQCKRAVLGQCCLARCDARLVLWSRRAENCGRPKAAIPDPGDGDACGDSTGVVLDGLFSPWGCGGLTCSCGATGAWSRRAENCGVPQLQCVEDEVDVPFVQVVEVPQVQFLDKGNMPVVVQR